MKSVFSSGNQCQKKKKIRKFRRRLTQIYADKRDRIKGFATEGPEKETTDYTDNRDMIKDTHGAKPHPTEGGEKEFRHISTLMNFRVGNRVADLRDFWFPASRPAGILGNLALLQFLSIKKMHSFFPGMVPLDFPFEAIYQFRDLHVGYQERAKTLCEYIIPCYHL